MLSCWGGDKHSGCDLAVGGTRWTAAGSEGRKKQKDPQGRTVCTRGRLRFRAGGDACPVVARLQAEISPRTICNKPDDGDAKPPGASSRTSEIAQTIAPAHCHPPRPPEVRAVPMLAPRCADKDEKGWAVRVLSLLMFVCCSVFLLHALDTKFVSEIFLFLDDPVQKLWLKNHPFGQSPFLRQGKF